MIKIALTQIEFEVARYVGRKRYNVSMKNGYRDKLNDPNVNNNVIGALGEIAFAKHLGIYWNFGVNTFHAADVGVIYQVRTRTKDYYDLYLRPGDNPEHIYILAIIETRMLIKLIGWDFGESLQIDEYWKSYGQYSSAWFVPQDKLRPIETLQAGVTMKCEM